MGIYNGSHERPISKMRKSDFMDFIYNQLQTNSPPLDPEIFYKREPYKIVEEDWKIVITKFVIEF